MEQANITEVKGGLTGTNGSRYITTMLGDKYPKPKRKYVKKADMPKTIKIIKKEVIINPIV